MRKKIFLFTGGLVLSLGGFALYMYLTGSDPFHMAVGPRQAQKPEITEGRDIERLYLEDRDVDGSLRYTVSADRAKPEGQTRFVLTQPRATAYTRDGRMILVTSDAGRLVVDPSAGKKQRNWPRSVTLTGNVTLTYGPQGSFQEMGVKELGPGQIQITMEKDVDIDLVQNLVTSPGGIHVRGDGITFNGANLTLAFNQAQSRIEYLRIEYGDKIVIRDPARLGRRQGGLLGNTGSSSRKPVETPKDDAGTVVTRADLPPITKSTTQDAKKDKKNARQETTYRLTFGQDVKATQGQLSMLAQTMAILFQAEPNEVKERTEPKTAGADDTTVKTPARPATQVAEPAATAQAPETQANPQEELVVQWVGSMEMRPVEPLPIRGVVFEAAGTPDQPVVVRNAQTEVKAGAIRYGIQAKQLEVSPQKDGTIEITDATLGSVRARAIAFNQQTGKLSLTGPGTADMKGNNGAQPVTARWGQSLDLEIIDVVDRSGKTRQDVRHALFTGGAEIKSPDFGITGQTLDAIIAHNQAAGAGARDLEHLLATGDVKIYSNRGVAGGKQTVTDSIASQKLELSSGDFSGRKAINFMHAEGNVLATYHEIDKGNGRVLTQQLAAPVMEADLEPRKDRASATPQATHMHATGGVRVTLEGYGNEPVVATSDNLDADPRNGTAKLVSGGKALSSLSRGENVLLAPVITFDQKTRSMEAPSAGEFRLVQAATPAEAARGAKPVPVVVKWASRMRYDGTNNLATFEGPIETSLVDRKDERSRLLCDRMQVLTSGRGADNSRAEGGLSAILASGHIRVEGEKLGPDGKPIMQMLLIEGKDPATGQPRGDGIKLRYEHASQLLTLTGPGDMLVTDHRPEDPRSNSSMRGDTAFTWAKSLTYDGRGGTITLSQDVSMVHQPLTALKLPNAQASTKPTRSKPGEKPEPLKLATQELTAYMAARGSNSPVALGVGGEGGGILKVTTANGTAGTFDINGGHYDLIANSSEMDMVKRVLTARGNPLQLQAVNANNINGTMSAQGVTMDLTTGNVVFEQQDIRGTMNAPLGP